MPLELVPEITAADYEKRLETARYQRLVLRMEFKKAYDLKLSALSRKTKDKLAKQLEIFAKELNALDKSIDRCAKRLEQVQIISNEVSYIQDQIEDD